MIVREVYEAAHILDNLADLINIAIEKLIKERYELPAFSTLDELLKPDEKTFRTPYNSLKQLPKKATLKHLQELIAHLEWLTGLGDYKNVLEGIPVG